MVLEVRSLFCLAADMPNEVCFVVVFSCSAASYIGSRFGRKPALLGIFLVSITGRSLLVISQSTSDAVQLPLLALWSFSESITNMVSAQFIFNLYAVDVAEAAERHVVTFYLKGQCF